MDPDQVISVRGLTKIFGDFWGRPRARAVSDLSFEVKRGEVFGLLGPNGSGKTTIIKILLGLLNPSRGHVEILGRRPRHVATKARIGYLPEESCLYQYLDARETLSFFGNLFGIDRRERQRRIGQLLEMVGLGKVLHRPVGDFSKGMQRRIGLAQALINDPDLVILDEPTAGLDPIGCREIKDLILTLARRGKTVVLSSHLLSDMQDLCDRVAILYGGRTQAVGTLDALLSSPDRVRLTLPAPETDRSVRSLQEALASLRGIPAEDIAVDRPVRSLESYFLDVVARARSRDSDTSGALAGRGVAEYLRGEESPDAALEALARPGKTSPPPPAATQEDSAPVDGDRLDELARSEETPEEEAVATPPAADEADRKLADLLGKEERRD